MKRGLHFSASQASGPPGDLMSDPWFSSQTRRGTMDRGSPVGARAVGRIRWKFLLELILAIFGGVLSLPRESFAQG
jgi:hypothetical protein